MNASNIWLFDGVLEEAIPQALTLPGSEGLGHVYVLALSNHHCLIGSARQVAKRLIMLRSDLAVKGLTIVRCSLTLAHVNYHTVEQGALKLLAPMNTGERVRAPFAVAQAAVEDQSLEFRVPPRLGIASGRQLTRQIRHLLAGHREVGRPLKPKKRAQALQAIAVLEAHTGLNQSGLRQVGEESV